MDVLSSQLPLSTTRENSRGPCNLLFPSKTHLTPFNGWSKAKAQLDKKIPGILNILIVACLEMSPDKRPPGMFEVKNQLEAVAKYLGLSEADIPGSEEVED